MELLTSSDYTLALGIIGRTNDLTLASIRPDGSPHATTVTFASDELTLYAAIGIDSEKAHNIRLDPRISLTLNTPYGDWNDIQGMSADGTAVIVGNPRQMARASNLLLHRFPQFAKFISGTTSVPWAGTVFIRISLESVALLDYARGFGHTGHFRVGRTTPSG